MSSRQKRKASSGNRIGMIFIGTVVGLLIVVMFVQRERLKKKIAQYQAANTVLTEQIQEEKDRSEELENLPDYVRSDGYIEKIAREKFGLVYEDEIIFKPEQ